MSKQTKGKVTFMTIAAFKKAIGVEWIEPTEWPKELGGTGKLHVRASDGTTYKCQHDLDTNEEMRFLLEEGKDIDQACLVNVKGNGESPLRPICRL